MSKIRKRRKTIPRRRHKAWQLQDAKARFSELVNEVINDGYQTITKNGHPVAVLISTSDFEKIREPKNSLLDFFREAPLPDLEIDTKRSKDTGRDVDL